MCHRVHKSHVHAGLWGPTAFRSPVLNRLKALRPLGDGKHCPELLEGGQGQAGVTLRSRGLRVLRKHVESHTCDPYSFLHERYT